MARKKSKSKNKAIWLEPGWLPFHYAYIPSKKAWDATREEQGLPEAAFPTSGGHCAVFERKDKEGLMIFVVFNLDLIDEISELVGIVSHEATHVWQFVKDFIGEQSPSPELEAYAIQSITQNIFTAVMETNNIDDSIRTI